MAFPSASWKRIILPAAALLAAAVRSSSAEADFAIDPALVQPLSEANEELIRSYPYLAHFQKGELNLYYVSARHESGADSETCGVIRRAFEAHPIRRVIVEGCSNGARELSRRRVAQIERESSGDPRKPDEADYATILGARVKAGTVCGEPDVRRQLNALKAAGYREEDYFGFAFARLIPAYRAQGRLAKEKPEDLYAETIAWRWEELGAGGAGPPDYAAFLRWYRAKTGNAFDPNGIVEAATAPDSGGSVLQRISDVVGQARNRFLARLISRELTRYKSVLVVYGNGHHAAQRRALVVAMGEPVYEGEVEKNTAFSREVTLDSDRSFR